MTPLMVGLMIVVWAFCIGAVLGYLTHRKPAKPSPADDAATATEAQRTIADSLTRLTEVAEGQCARMVAAGWNPDIAQAVSATTLMRLIDATTRT